MEIGLPAVGAKWYDPSRSSPPELIMRPSRLVSTVLLGAFVGTSIGCTGSRDGAAEQLRSAISFDGVPEQYEPEIEETDEFEPSFEE